MSDNNQVSLKEAIQQLLNVYRLNEKVDGASVRAVWDKIMPPAITTRTESLSLNKKTLYIKLNSAALRSELAYGKDQLIDNLNRELGKQVIDEVIIR